VVTRIFHPGDLIWYPTSLHASSWRPGVYGDMGHRRRLCDFNFGLVIAITFDTGGDRRAQVIESLTSAVGWIYTSVIQRVEHLERR